MSLLISGDLAILASSEQREEREVSSDWKFVGFAEGFLGGLVAPHKYIVKNRATGARRTIWAHDIDDIGRAIADGDWAD